MAAALAPGIHLDNKQKRNAAAIDVFLNVETQRKILKVATNRELTDRVRVLEDHAGEPLAENQGQVDEIKHLKEELEDIRVGREWVRTMQEAYAGLTPEDLHASAEQERLW